LQREVETLKALAIGWEKERGKGKIDSLTPLRQFSHPRRELEREI
jgi:hypothetical protein